MVVRPFASCFRESRIPASVAESKAEVASSHTSKRGARRNALAMATLCFSPPLSFSPRSPTMVSYPAGIFMMAS
eukprot:scaffold285_cov330-Pavlova_lutheri.AAC.15